MKVPLEEFVEDWLRLAVGHTGALHLGDTSGQYRRLEELAHDWSLMDAEISIQVKSNSPNYRAELEERIAIAEKYGYRTEGRTILVYSDWSASWSDEISRSEPVAYAQEMVRDDEEE